MRRTLNLNKTKLWYVYPIGTQDAVDSEGNYTGETIKLYSNPVAIYISLYPAYGAVVEQIFGKDASLDMVAISNEYNFSKDTLFYLNQPTSNFGRNYDYYISDMKSSINTHNYGLRRRT